MIFLYLLTIPEKILMSYVCLQINPDKAVLSPPLERNGPGEMGKPVVLDKDLDPEIKKKVDKGWQDNAFNQYVSDMISLHRSLPDPRDEW